MTTPDSHTPLVSVVIVNYNGGDVLAPCLRSVYAQPYLPLEIIVVDNGSTDGSRALLRREFPGVRVLAQERNLGFAEGNNRGVASAAGDCVVLLNNDTEVTAGWIPALLRLLDVPGVAAVTSRVVTDGVPKEYYAMNGTVNYLGYNIMRAFSDLSSVFFAGGASLMFRKSVVGTPFLPEYFLYQEDLFLSWRLRLAGYDVRMAQESVVYHRGSVTSRKQPGRLVTYYQERNRLLNCLLLYSPVTLLKISPLAVADALAKILLSILTRRKSFVGIVHSYLWCLTHWCWISICRKSLQAGRRVADRDILKWMSPRIVEGNGIAARCLNACARTYARIVRLPYHA